MNVITHLIQPDKGLQTNIICCYCHGSCGMSNVSAIFSRAVLSCVRAMRRAEDKCYAALPPVVEHILCWPMKLTAFCKIADSN